jgi:sugar phosphate isomerase/epimerase
MNGDHIRETIARDLQVSTRTLDRMIAKAKALGLLDGIEIPRRPSPRQRDLLLARHLAEKWLDENGPYAEPPPEWLAEIDRLEGKSAKPTKATAKKRSPKR